jgi:xylan 1,4-beta-xylosidase
VISFLPDQLQTDALTPPIPIAPAAPVELGVDVDEERLLFSYRLAGGEWQWLPQTLDASVLSDEATAPGLPNFTGAFVGMACHDVSGTAKPADFDYFEYVERPYVAAPDAPRSANA